MQAMKSSWALSRDIDLGSLLEECCQMALSITMFKLCHAQGFHHNPRVQLGPTHKDLLSKEGLRGGEVFRQNYCSSDVKGVSRVLPCKD